MNRLRRIYTFSIFGALGGLLASMVHQVTLLDTLSAKLPQNERLGYLAFLGGLIGLAIGFFPNFWEGLTHYSLRNAWRSGIIGSLCGAFGGLVALPLAELINVHLGGGYLGRPAAFAIFGLAIGISEATSGGGRLWQAPLGGVIGGALAGAILEYFVISQATRSFSGLTALIIIGVSVSLFISLSVAVLSDARLEGLPGSKFKGQVFYLSKFREPHEAIFGSDKGSPTHIWIYGAEPKHASITLTRSGARLRHLSRSGVTRVNSVIVSERLLRDGDEIEVGPARFTYREQKSPAYAVEKGHKVRKAHV